MGDSVFLDRQNSYLVSNRFIGHKLIRSAWILLIWRTERLNILVHVWRALMYGLTCLMSLNRMIHFQHCKQALLYSSFRLTGPVWVLTKMTVSKWKPVSCDGTSEVTCGAQHHMFPGFVEQTSAQRTAWRGPEMRRKGIWHHIPRCPVTTWRQNRQMWCGSRPWTAPMRAAF